MTQCPQCGVKLRRKASQKDADLVKNIADEPLTEMQADGAAQEGCAQEANNADGKAINCRICGKPIFDTFEFCPYCGESVKNRCGNCGFEMGDSDRYCSQCGHPVEKRNKKRVKQVKVVQRLAKAPDKHTKNIVKSAICLALSMLLFAFAFCPICAQLSYHYDIVIDELSGIDYIDIMFATAKHYDKEDDATKIEKLEKEISKLEEELEKESANRNVLPKNVLEYSAKAKDLSHKIAVKSIKKSVMVDGSLSDANEGQYIVIGVLSLLYILLSAVMLVLSAVALTLNIISLKTGKVFEKFASCKYICAMPMFLFLSIAITFSMVYSSSVVAFMTPLAATFKARLAFESLAVALVIADIIVNITNKNEKVQKGIFKAGALVLSLVAVACCFAPCFKGVATRTSDDGDDRIVSAQAPLGLLNVIDMSDEMQEYLDERADSTDSYYKNIIKNAINRQINCSNGVGIVAEYAMWSKYKSGDAGKVSMGFYFAILAIILFGVSACFACDDKQSSASLRKAFWALAIIFVIAMVLTYKH